MAREVILITGCSGRIGFKAAERFSEQFQIVGFDIYLAGHLPEVEFFGVDIASDESVEAGLEQVKRKYGDRIASVIHLAAYYNFSGGSWGSYDRITVQGTRRLLEGLKKRFTVEQFLFTSTMLVHAPCKVGETLTEDSPLLPKWEYPRSKVETEALIRQLHGEIPSVTLRIAGVYDDHCHSIPLSHQLARIYENQMESHLFAGNTTHGASYLHMDDLIDALWLCVQRRKQLPAETVLLLGEPTTLSYEEIQNGMSLLLYKKEWTTLRVPKAVAKVGAWVQNHLPFMKESFIKPWMMNVADDHYALDISRAKQLLGWEPKRKLKESMPRWIEELKCDPIAWYDENKLKPPAWLYHKKSA